MVYDLKDAKKVKLELKGHERSKPVTSVLFTRAYKPSRSGEGKVTPRIAEPQLAE